MIGFEDLKKEDVRKDYLIFFILPVSISFILAILISSVGTGVVGYRPSYTEKLLGTFAGLGLFTGSISAIGLILYAGVERLSEKKTFNPKQFAAVILAGILIFGSSLALASFLVTPPVELGEDDPVAACMNALETSTSITNQPVEVPAHCFPEAVDQIEGLEDAEKGDRVRKTREGYEVVESP
jgi:hypothetical protein